MGVEMFKILLIAFGFILFPSTSQAQIVCTELGDISVCSDNQGNVFTVNRLGEITIVTTTPKKKPGFFERLGKFGNSLEEGFTQPHRNNYRHHDDVDPLCVTPLQRRVNNCK